MLNQNQYTELKVFMERQAVALEHLQKNSIPEGLKRMEKVEKDVTHLNMWKYGISMVGVFMVGLFKFLDK